jgi:hypothetical protein
MRGKSQFLRSRNLLVDEILDMKTPMILLLTDDNELEDLVT